MRTYAGIISAFYDKNKALVKHWNKSKFLQMKSILCPTYLNPTELRLTLEDGLHFPSKDFSLTLLIAALNIISRNYLSSAVWVIFANSAASRFAILWIWRHSGTKSSHYLCKIQVFRTFCTYRTFFTHMDSGYANLLEQLRNGKRAACNHRVMDVRGMLLSTKEA